MVVGVVCRGKKKYIYINFVNIVSRQIIVGFVQLKGT